MTNKLSHIFECLIILRKNSIGPAGHFLSSMDALPHRFLRLLPAHFLSGLAYLVGAGTALTGIIAALPTLMNTIQIFSLRRL